MAGLVADELFREDEREAWGRYLRDTRGWQPDKYEMVEPLAWRRLEQQLSAAWSRLQGRSRGRPKRRTRAT